MPAVHYDSFLDQFGCQVADEHLVEGQEIGVSFTLYFIIIPYKL